MTAGPAFTWLYAVVPADTPATAVRRLDGVAGEPPRLLTAAPLAAVVGQVPGEDFDAPALERHLRDPDWLERAVRAHHRVIETLARVGSTLPLRFATLYRDEQRVGDLLVEHRDELQAALARLGDRTEWGVKAYLDTAHRDDPEDEARRSGPGPERPGTAYLLRRRAARDRAARVLDEAADRAREVHRALTAFAGAATVHPPQPPEATGVRDPMVLNGAYLVDRDGAGEFAALVSDLRREHAPLLRLELTGPWPPYSFVDLPSAGGE